MTEPVYVYKKGEGWVLTPLFPVVRLACGTTVRIEPRIPEPGEKWEGLYLAIVKVS